MKLFYATLFPALTFQSESFSWKGSKKETMDAKNGKIGNFDFSKEGFEVKITSVFSNPEWSWSQPITFGQPGGAFTCQKASNNKGTWSPEYTIGSFEPSDASNSIIEFSYSYESEVRIFLKNEHGYSFISGYGNQYLKRAELLEFSLTFHPTFFVFSGKRQNGKAFIRDFHNMNKDGHKVYYDQYNQLSKYDASPFFRVNNDDNDDDNEGWYPTDESLDLFTGPAVEDFDAKGCKYEFERYAGVLLGLEIGNLEE